MRQEIRELAKQVEQNVGLVFDKIDEVALFNTEKVLDAFRKHRVSDTYFAGTTGYGYDDLGREMLDKIYADVFGAESALVRIGFVNGTHTIACALFGAVEPNKKLLSISGMPYDTILSTIGVTGDYFGSLKHYGVGFDYVDLKDDGTPDFGAIEIAAKDPEVGAIAIQRSRGYSMRPALTIEQIGDMISCVRKVNPDVCIFVDNCYGEFTDKLEPTQVGADLIAGSLIKNAGGGIAPTGGYIAGKAKYVERASYRMTAPGIGGECGATLGNNALLYKGFFLAPHVVGQALKTAVFCAGMLEELGYESSPSAFDKRSDIVQVVKLGTGEKLCQFCKGIQFGAAVDSFATPQPAPMPGYEDDIVMASGSFIQGSTIELSADGPMREPYCAYLQGGLTYESGKLGIMYAVSEMMD